MSEQGWPSASKKSTVEENSACLGGPPRAGASSGGSSQLVLLVPPSSLGVLARLRSVSSVTCADSDVLLGDVAQLDSQEQLVQFSELGESVRLPEPGRPQGPLSWARMVLYGGGGVLGRWATSS